MRVYRTRRRRRRRAIIAGLLAGAALVGVLAAILGTGGGSPDESSGPPVASFEDGEEVADALEPPEIERFQVGSGARSAVVMQPEGGDSQPGVIFLHGWGEIAPRTYGPWLAHLAHQGNTVIYPRYQESASSPPDRVLDDAIAGVEAALERAPIAEGSLVVAGHSAGAALAVDFAAVAEQRGLPVPLAVFAVYPGRSLLAYPEGIPAQDEGNLPPDLRLTVLAGAADEVVGEAPAQQVVEAASTLDPARTKLVEVTDSSVAGHYGPERASEAARVAFWRPLDALAKLARPE